MLTDADSISYNKMDLNPVGGNMSRRDVLSSRSLLLITGAILQALPVFFPAADILAAVCSFCWTFFFLYAARKAERPRQVVLAGLVFYISLCVRYGAYLGFSLRGILTMCGALIPLCFLLWIPFVIDRIIFRRHGGFLISFIFPVLYSAVLLLINQCRLPVIAAPACAAIVFPSVSQISSLILSFGLDFLILSLSSFLLYGITGSRTPGRIFAFIVAAVITVSVPIYGSVRLARRNQPASVLHVALLNKMDSDFYAVGYPYSEEEAMTLFEQHLAFASSGGASLAVSSEEYLYFPINNEPACLSEISRIISKYGIPVLLSVEETGSNTAPGINRSLLFDGNGQLLCSYTKHNLVPFVESGYYVSGENDPAEYDLEICGEQIRIAVAICYDCSDVLFTKRISPDVQLLINPCWEWDVANVEQRRIVSMRAVENNLTLLKHTYSGWSCVVDPYGIIRSSTDTRTLPGQMFIVDVPIYKR